MNEIFLTNKEIIFPYISDELINCLNLIFPNKLPTTKISEFELGVLVGQQQVIDRLIFEKNVENEDDN